MNDDLLDCLTAVGFGLALALGLLAYFDVLVK